jgi:hypothetical protein
MAAVCNLPGLTALGGDPFVFDYVERESMVKFHTGGPENGAQGTSGTPLFPDDFANILMCYPQPDNGRTAIIDQLNLHVVGLVYKRTDNIQHQVLHQLRWSCGNGSTLTHVRTPLENVPRGSMRPSPHSG